MHGTVLEPGTKMACTGPSLSSVFYRFQDIVSYWWGNYNLFIPSSSDVTDEVAALKVQPNI